MVLSILIKAAARVWASSELVLKQRDLTVMDASVQDLPRTRQVAWNGQQHDCVVGDEAQGLTL